METLEKIVETIFMTRRLENALEELKKCKTKHI